MFNFTVKEFILGSGTGTPTLQFYKRGFELNGGGESPSWQDIILSGNTALTLANALANGLNYLKLFGATEQRNIPSEYTQVEYVTNTAPTWLDTGVKFDFSKNYEIELRVKGVTGSWYILQAKEVSGNEIWGFSGSQNGQTIRLGFGTNSATSQISRVAGNIYYLKGTINNGNLTLYVKDETAGTEDTATGTYTVTTGQSVNICLFGNLASQYVGIGSNVYFARVKENGNYIMNYVPCKQGTTAGFYDKASDTFKTTTNLSAGADVTTPSPDYPMDIVCNNGVIKVNSQGQVYTDGTQETVTVTGKNLLDMANANIHSGFISANINQPIAWQASSVTSTVVNAVSIKAGETYTFSSFNGINGTLNLCIINNDIVLQKISYDITANQRTSVSISATVNGQLYIQYVIAGQDFQLEQGSTATAYEPYFNGGTATAEMLLKVGTYQDVQSVLDGGVTRKVGIKVFDGTESISKSDNRYFYSPPNILNVGNSRRSDVFSTHFRSSTAGRLGDIFQYSMQLYMYADMNVYTTVTEFKQWLSDQYNAGTPVIIVYPSATPTTETVTGQPLSIQAGTNIITAEGSIDNLELEVSYKATV